jgi:hypothetical protein
VLHDVRGDEVSLASAPRTCVRVLRCERQHRLCPCRGLVDDRSADGSLRNIARGRRP